MSPARLFHQCVLQGRFEREPLDPLRRPLCPDFAARYPPNLFRIGFEKCLIEVLAEAVRHPLLEGFLVSVRKQMGMAIAQEYEAAVPYSKPEQSINRAQRIEEELVVVVDSRQAVTMQYILVKDFSPHLLSGPDFCKETMSAKVKEVVPIIECLRNTADLSISFDYDELGAALMQLISGSQSCRPGADDHNLFQWVPFTEMKKMAREA
jgi:hypothetical protein